MRAPAILSLLLVAARSVSAGYDAGSNSNVAVYWGQNSAGFSTNDPTLQKRLSHYCDSDDVDIIIMAFIVELDAGSGIPTLNFANDLTNCTTDEKGVPICTEIGKDIGTCQKNGKTILLSIGGDAGAKIDFPTAEAATKNAQLIWSMFGPTPASGEKPSRPFGEAVIDGFDLDIETKPQHYAEWAHKMRELMGPAKDGKGYLTAAPQCPVPSGNPIGSILNGTEFDMFFVQFYNNPCGPHNETYTFSDWNTFAQNKTKVFLGLPADVDAAPSGGYIKPEELGEVIKETKDNDMFGGVMLWDASQAWTNDNYHTKVKQALKSS